MSKKISWRKISLECIEGTDLPFPLFRLVKTMPSIYFSLPASSVYFTHLCLLDALNCTNIFTTSNWTVQVGSMRDVEVAAKIIFFFFLFTNIIVFFCALIVHFHEVDYTKAYAENWQIVIANFSAISQNSICIEKIFYVFYCC